MISLILQGMLVSGSLIMAIGSQNAFVLKQGLLRENIFVVCFICFICDFFLMSFGVFGIGKAINSNTTLSIILALCGAIFLLYYGFTSFISSFRATNHIALDISKEREKTPVGRTILATLAITLLNPHVYLDTVVIVGGVAGTLDFTNKFYFLIGALVASFSWFFVLGFGARLLTPIFVNPKSWRVLEFIIGCIMWYIAYTLIDYSLTAYNNLL